MNKYHSILKNEWPIILVLIFYLLISVLLLNYYQYILNSDGISYISIAQKYLNGNFTDAINGYWGPLFSWLLTPFLFFGSTPLYTLYSTKLLSIILGFFAIFGTRLLIYRFEIDKSIEIALLISLVPVILYFAFNLITPDLLVTCILIYYLYVIFDPNYSNKMYNGFLCGLIGALAYLSKSYALPFFLAHFILFNLVYYFKSFTNEEKQKIIKNFLLGLTIFFIISGVWIALISDKYGKITIGTTGEYNQALVGPQSQELQPMYYQGLIKPPNNSAVNIWEDPYYLKMNSWSPLESWDYFKHEMNLILGNVFYILNIMWSFSILSLIIIIGSILFIIKSQDVATSKNKMIYLLTTITIYTAGYSLIIVESRYLWFICILLILMGGYLINTIFQMDFFKKSLKGILLASFVFLIIINSLGGLIHDFGMSEGVYNLGETLKNDYNITGNIASNDEWERTIFLVYCISGKYYGLTNENSTDKLTKELKDNNIDYYFVWGNSKENDYLSHHFKEITNGNIENLKIYHLKN